MIPQRHHAIAVHRSFARVARFDRALPAALCDDLLSDPHSILHAGVTMRRTGQRRTVRFTWASQAYVLKHYRPTWWHAARPFSSRSIAWQTSRVTRKFIRVGINTPRPLACIENRLGGLRRDSYLLYPYVEGQILNTYFGAPEQHDHLHMDGLWQQLDDLWRRLAKLRVTLGDPNLNNFIVAPDGQLWVIDLDNTRFHRTALTAANALATCWKKLLRGVAPANIRIPSPPTFSREALAERAPPHLKRNTALASNPPTRPER